MSNLDIEDVYVEVHARIEKLRGIVKDYCKHHGLPQDCTDPQTLFFQWHSLASRSLQERLNGQYLSDFPEHKLYKLNEPLDDVLRRFHLYHRVQCPWQVYFAQGLLESVQHISESDRHNALLDLIRLATGRLNLVSQLKHLQSGPYIGMQVFLKEYETCSWLFTTEVVRCPIVEDEEITKFHYSQHWRVIAILSSPEKAASQLQQYLQTLTRAERMRPVDIPHHQNVGVTWRESFKVKGTLVHPQFDLTVNLSPEESQQFIFDRERQEWMECQDYNAKVANENMQETKLEAKINSSVFQNLFTPKTCFKLARMFKQLPALRWAVSDEELKIISQKGNVMVIGRSGTGKTTSAVLRILAMEWLFRFYYKRQPQRVLGDTSIHNVFLSVSPVLCGEVRNFYYNMINSARREDQIRATQSVARSQTTWQQIDREGLQKFPVFISLKTFLYFVDKTTHLTFFDHSHEAEAGNLGYHRRREGVAYVYTPDRSRSVLGFEVTYAYFCQHWRQRLKSWTSLSPLTVWTELCSVIKGSPEAYKTDGHLSREEYLALGKKVSLLTPNQRKTIWKLFLEYEEWKLQQKAYDFQDVVNHLLYNIHFNSYTGPQLHFMTIDEVQDCSKAALLLLCKITQQNLFFSGDTAQTISEGVGFRFCDLESLFRDPSVIHQGVSRHQLCINYRSHQRILDLGNSVVELLQSLFPETIDPLAPEASVRDGAMPLLVDDLDVLANLLVVQDDESEETTVDFGCGQVVIVRQATDPESLPHFLRNSVTLTVLESKGLEFINVIVYNFFHDSMLSQDEWQFLSRVKSTKQFDKAKYAMLCYELKHLYVAITRAKKRVIFYDESIQKRRVLTQLWLEKGLVHVVRHQAEARMYSAPDRLDSEEWLEQGHRLFRSQLYRQARLCFAAAGVTELESRAMGFEKAETATKIMHELSGNPDSGGNSNADSQKKEAMQLFKDAAERLKKAGDYSVAGQCFYSCKQIEQALDCFVRGRNYLEAGEIHLERQEFRKAYQMFVKVPHYAKSLDCLLVIDYNESVKFLAAHHQHIHPSMVEKANVKLAQMFLPKISRYVKAIPDRYKINLSEAEETIEPAENFVETVEKELNPQAEEWVPTTPPQAQTTEDLPFVVPGLDPFEEEKAAYEKFMELRYPRAKAAKQTCTVRSRDKLQKQYMARFFEKKAYSTFFLPEAFNGFMEFSRRVIDESNAFLEPIRAPCSALLSTLKRTVSPSHLKDREIATHCPSAAEAFLLEVAWNSRNYEAFIGLCELFGRQVLLADRISELISYAAPSITTKIPYMFSREFLSTRRLQVDQFNRDFASVVLSYLSNPNSSAEMINHLKRAMIMFGFWRKFLPVLGVYFSLNFFQFNAVYALEIQRSITNWADVPLAGSIACLYEHSPIVKTAFFEEVIIILNKQSEHTLRRGPLGGSFSPSELVNCIPQECKCMFAYWQHCIGVTDDKALTSCIDHCYTTLIKHYRYFYYDPIELLQLKDCMAFLIHIVFSYSSVSKTQTFLEKLRLFQREKLLFCVLIACKVLRKGELRDDHQYFLLDSLFWSLGVKPVDSALVEILALVTHSACLSTSKLLYNLKKGQYLEMWECLSVDETGELCLVPTVNMIETLKVHLFTFAQAFIKSCIQATDNSYKCRLQNPSKTMKTEQLKTEVNRLGCHFLFCRIAACLKHSVRFNIFFKQAKGARSSHFIANYPQLYTQIVEGKKQFPFEKFALTYWTREALLHAALKQARTAKTAEEYEQVYWIYALLERRPEFLNLVHRLGLQCPAVCTLASIDICVSHGDLNTALRILKAMIEDRRSKKSISVRVEYALRSICYIIKGYFWSSPFRESLSFVPRSLANFFRAYYPKMNTRYSRVSVIPEYLDTFTTVLNKYFMWIRMDSQTIDAGLTEVFASSILLLMAHVYPVEIPKRRVETLKTFLIPYIDLRIVKKLSLLTIEETVDTSHFLHFIFQEEFTGLSPALSVPLQFNLEAYLHQISNVCFVHIPRLGLIPKPRPILIRLRKLYSEILRRLASSKHRTALVSDLHRLASAFFKGEVAFNQAQHLIRSFYT